MTYPIHASQTADAGLAPFKLAVIGNGSSAVNAVDGLVNYFKSSPLPVPLQITLFGNTPEADCGKGFAYGKIAGAIGNLTESPANGHADYSRAKGAFVRYASQLLGATHLDLHCASRKLIGHFHADRFQELKNGAGEIGIDIGYRQTHVTNLTKGEIGYSVAGNNRLYGEFDRVVLAVGDVLSRRFDAAVAHYPGRVFATPYHAVDDVIKRSDSSTIITAFGTRSSFVDLVNGFIANGYKGKIIGVSSSGQTSWQGPREKAKYGLKHLTENRIFKSVPDILNALHAELSLAKQGGVFVPDGLLQAVNAATTTRVRWDFNLREEAANADKVSYRNLVSAVNWVNIYENLPDAKEKKRFNDVLSDLIVYSCVNRIVPNDYKQFIQNFNDNKIEIIKSSFSQDDIHSTLDGRLAVSLANGGMLKTDYVINCAIGPASSSQQGLTSELLHNLVRKKWLSPRDGTGFDVAAGDSIDIVGAQARPYLFSGIGIETYGAQIESLVPKIAQEIYAYNNSTRPQLSLTQRRITHG